MRMVFVLLALAAKKLSFLLWSFHESMLKATDWATARADRLKAEQIVFEQHMAKKPKCTGVEGTTILTEVTTSEVVSECEADDSKADAGLRMAGDQHADG